MSCQNTAAERQTAAQHVRRPGNSDDVSATQRPSSSAPLKQCLGRQIDALFNSLRKAYQG